MDMTVIAQLLRVIAWLLFALFLLALSLLWQSFIIMILACGAALQGMVFLWSTPKNS